MVTTSKRAQSSSSSDPPVTLAVTSMMTDPSLQNIVPACPQGLCINKTDFLKPDFTVDNFFIEVSVREGGTSLDTLRDDLGVYLKVLRSSMIELINQDYADFVNLSTNLVGLDQGINAIRDPLGVVNEEIIEARSELSLVLDNVRRKLSRQERIRQEKEMLGSLQQVAAITNKVERMVMSGDLTTDTAERIAADVNQLNFAIWKLKESKFIQGIIPRVSAVCDSLNTWLNDTCLKAIRDNNSVQLSRCLRIYVTIDRVSAAETLVREEIVSPQVNSCLADHETVSSDNLEQLCQSLLRIIPQHMSLLIKLTTDTDKIIEGSVSGFDFLANSFWLEVSEKFSDNLADIASPGNPDEFFKNYNICIKFLDDFEQNIVSENSLDTVRNSEGYSNFLKSWNLAVYFQLRFHEIAKPVESIMITTTLDKTEKGQFKLKVTDAVVTAIESCFKPGIYLPVLSHRFVQLSLQIVSRYRVWAELCLKTFQDPPAQNMKRSDTSSNLQSGNNSNKSMTKSSSERDLAKTAAPAVLTVSMAEIINLYSDLSRLATILPNIISLPSLQNIDISPVISESVASLSSVLPSISSAISNNVAAAPLKSVKSVVDIPRMYRRTNRDSPSKPCSYIVSIVDSLRSFYTGHQSSADTVTLTSWLSQACHQVSEVFLVQVQDVLANVTKMEESLRKLKKVRDRATVGAGDKEGKSGKLSDDDKIRLQLYLDVSYYLREMGEGSFGNMQSVLAGESCVKIKAVVDQAVSSFVAQLEL